MSIKATSTSQWRRIRAYILNRDGHECAWCGMTATTVDHIIPQSRWPEGEPGMHDPDNLVAACATCNYSRQAKPIDVFLATRATAPNSVENIPVPTVLRHPTPFDNLSGVNDARPS